MPRSRRAARPSRASADPTRARFAATWRNARRALASAEARLEPALKTLIGRAAIDLRQAAETLNGWRGRVREERRTAFQQLEQGLSRLQSRARKERHALAGTVANAVRGTLVRLDIPTRRELVALTRKVDELSARLAEGGARRRSGHARRAAPRARHASTARRTPRR
jgi:hypothetical protein